MEDKTGDAMRTIDRILAIADIHGENGRLQKLLAKAEYQPDNDLLVICGDMIDRGKENLATLDTCEKLRKNGAVLLKGNHEQFLQESAAEMTGGDDWRNFPSDSLRNWYTHNGGAEMFGEIKDLPKDKLGRILAFMQSLPLYFSVGNFIFYHAGANVKKPIAANSENETVWMDESFPYSPAYPGKVHVFGHVPTWKLYPYGKKFKKANSRIWFDKVNKDKVGIDCGGVFGGRLAALELPTYREYYV